jgi:hypothetical protein
LGSLGRGSTRQHPGRSADDKRHFFILLATKAVSRIRLEDIARLLRGR